ncbi:MAG TPA: proline--tRNA ligase [Verrucomicrobiae bacterium]|nr:proline--tRNA ligase [Verrucomicrobiae bacterium]
MHSWSELFVPTLREAPADAEVASHKFLVRAGYIRQLAAGIYSYLFLGNRSFVKISAIVRQEMDKIGQEFFLPALHPREVWEASGRFAAMGENLFRLKDRKGAELCLGMTEEEVMTMIALKDLRSYKQLPQIWYQIAPKFRDEPRPRSGLLRVRQFMMKDSYSFDIDAAGLDVSYKKHYDAYCRIFDRCGLTYLVVEADSGAMGGSQSEEFMVYTEAGEDHVASCGNCKYSANIEKATAHLKPPVDLAARGNGQPQEVATPNLRSIDEVAQHLNVQKDQTIKAVAFLATYKAANGILEVPVIAFIRGDRSLNETKLGNELRAKFSGAEFRMMTPDEVEGILGVPHGFLGPYNTPKFNRIRETIVRPQIYYDRYLDGRHNMVAGANKKDAHFWNITPGRDFHINRSQLLEGGVTEEDERDNALLDLLLVEDGDPCPRCDHPLKVGKAVEIGHIFKLGYKYSKSMGLRVLDKNGKEVMPIMGSYGIGIERILTAAVEQGNDQDGFWLPTSIAPFEIVVTPVNVKDEAVRTAAEDIVRRLEQAGFDVVLDDRDERPGVKFKDADLVGIPFRVNVGKKVTEGTVEVVIRSTREVRDVTITAVVEYFQELLGRR